MAGGLTIISCGTRVDDLSAAARQAVAACDLLYGGARLLDWFPESTAEKQRLTGKMSQEIEALVAQSAHRQIGVLASGDASFFGIAARFCQQLPLDRLKILPGISAMQVACAKLGLDWAGCDFFSIHGRDLRLPWRKILQSRCAVVYGDPQRTPAWMAAELIRHYPAAAQRAAVLLENLGGADESIQRGDLSELAMAECGGLSMLILLPVEVSSQTLSVDVSPYAELSLGLPDDAYEHAMNMITHPELRAVALAKLRLRPGVLWDLGAGSGSVGIEAAGLIAGLQVYSVEKHPDRAGMVERNIAAQGLNNVQLMRGRTLEVLPKLPQPTAVFIGGGGREIGAIVEAALAALPVGGRLVATAVLADTVEQLNHVALEFRVEWLEISINRARPLVHSYLMAPDTPIHLFVFQKK
jgi:precorrin-6Y C5,15-methyltransferase (decarboxylating)